MRKFLQTALRIFGCSNKNFTESTLVELGHLRFLWTESSARCLVYSRHLASAKEVANNSGAPLSRDRSRCRDANFSLLFAALNRVSLFTITGLAILEINVKDFASESADFS